VIGRLFFNIFRRLELIPEPIRSAIINLIPIEWRARAVPEVVVMESIEAAARLIAKPDRDRFLKAFAEWSQIPEVQIFRSVGFFSIRLSPDLYPLIEPGRNAFLEFRVVLYNLRTGEILRTALRFGYGEMVDPATLFRRILHLLTKERPEMGYWRVRNWLAEAVVGISPYLRVQFRVE
jgi:hypothetical protein